MADQPTTTSRSKHETWGDGSGAMAELRWTPQCWRAWLRGADGSLVAAYPSDGQEAEERDARECFEEFKRAIVAGEYGGRVLP